MYRPALPPPPDRHTNAAQPRSALRDASRRIDRGTKGIWPFGSATAISLCRIIDGGRHAAGRHGLAGARPSIGMGNNGPRPQDGSPGLQSAECGIAWCVRPGARDGLEGRAFRGWGKNVIPTATQLGEQCGPSWNYHDVVHPRYADAGMASRHWSDSRFLNSHGASMELQGLVAEGGRTESTVILGHPPSGRD